jgi:hypothetical protein
MTCFGMIDIETLDVTPGGQILSIGAVKFDPFSFKDTHSEFYYRFDIDEQTQLGRSVSDETLDWWGNQSAPIIEEAFTSDGRTDCKIILTELKKWSVGVDEFWSQGRMDVNMLENMYRQFDMPIPWAFWATASSREFLRRMPSDPRKANKFAAHHPVEDCKAQVDALRKTFKHFGMTK